LTSKQLSGKLVWKRGDGWVQYNPPRSHPSYEGVEETKREGERK